MYKDQWSQEEVWRLFDPMIEIVIKIQLIAQP